MYPEKEWRRAADPMTADPMTGDPMAAASLPPDLLAFADAAKAALDDVAVDLDAPADPDGEWWIDLKAGLFGVTLAWRRLHGFGVFTADPGFGDRPDEVYRTPELAVRRIRQMIRASGDSSGIAPMQFRDVRALLGVHQENLATRMHVKQAAISKFEARRDVKLSSAASYVAALGGRLEMKVVFDDFSVSVSLPQDGPHHHEA